MLEKNHIIYTLHEADVSVERVYNSFWEAESRIIYVVDAADRLTGVITNKDFMLRVRTGQPLINKEYSVIPAGEETAVFREAEALYEKYHITTAIPVVDEEKKICYEIRRKRDNDDAIFAKFRHKIAQYEKSAYLGQEIKYLREIFRLQTVTVIGTRKRFDDLWGQLFPDTEHVIFLEEVKHAFEFMSGHRGLLIDVSVTPWSGRNELYHFGVNGYSCYSFADTVIKMIELECFSRFYRVTGNSLVTLKDYLEKYSDGKVYISSWGILTAAMKRYLSDSRLELVEQRGICREKSFQYYYTGNGVRINQLTGGELLVMEQADVILQYYHISRELAGRIPVLNFVFDVNVQIPGRETEEITAEKLFYLNEYVADIEKGEEKKSYYMSETDSLSYLKAITPSFQLHVTRRTENDLLVWKNHKSHYVNVTNGVRNTCGQPEEYYGTVYCFGMCTMYGALVEDAYTIPSLLQKKINASGKKYRLVNMGNEVPVSSRAICSVMDIQSNDIVIILFPFVTERVKKAIPFIEVGEDYNELWKRDFYGKDCFMDAVQHCGNYGNILYAEVMQKELEKYLVNTENKRLKRNTIYNIFKNNTTDLDTLYAFDSFVTELQNEKKKIPADVKKVGCIVMNCNPMTLGHRYLIEYAYKCVDYLFIFVVEENRSFFSFKDRFEMVKRGTRSLERVSVIRSGKLVISSNTFPTYFEKEDIEQKENICVEEDIRVFAQYIAPILGISYRFIGEEPLDYVTRQYNIAMKRILPSMFGIHVVEIPRLKMGNTIISATEVRKLYGRRQFDSMKKYVPDTTFDYLVEVSQNQRASVNSVAGGGKWKNM